eukprot:4875277-Pyramimonas_sp.AAC.2
MKGPYHLDLEEIPTFRPTKAQFESPTAFIASIRDEAEPFGLARIVPPDGWKPPWSIPKEHFKFATRVQVVNELVKHVGTARRKRFKVEYEIFLKSQGTPVRPWPIMGGSEVDLSRLYELVTKRGGHARVTEERQWLQVSRALGITMSSSVSTALRECYQKRLLAFESHKKGASIEESSSKQLDLKADAVGKLALLAASLAGKEDID